MPTPEQLAAQAEAIAAVRIARLKRDKVSADAEQELRAAIRAAYDTGASVRNIAIAANRTPARIYQILHEG